MTAEARKYKLIHQITRIEDEAALQALEEIVERLLQVPGESAPSSPVEPTMAAYRGILSAESTEALLEYVTQSRVEWGRNI